MKKKDEIMAYLAGVMDGDGSFSIGKLPAPAAPLYFPLLQCNTWRSFIFLLKEKFGGTLFKDKHHICKDGSKGHALIRWRLRSQKNVLPVLEKIIPFLQIKKERAQFLKEFIEKNPFVRGQILSLSIIEDRERDYLKMIQFNEWKQCHQKITQFLAKGMSEDTLFWSYMAGLMDTDGSFALKKQVQNKGTDVKNPRYLPVISLSMTDTRAINYLRENCNVGKLYIPKNKSTNAGFHYQFGIYTKNECMEFLKRVIPFLHSKKENAQILLGFCEQSQNTKYCKAGIPEEELIFREQCYQTIKSLNKYGVSKPTLIDLEAQKQGDKGEGAIHAERLNEMASKEDAIV
jgi:hypothetical protein